MGSYFKGWADTQPYISQPRSKSMVAEIFIGHVISIDYEQFGKIKVRIIGRSQDPDDDNIVLEAYPADQNIIKYPLPGELVILVQSLLAVDQIQIAYFYISVLSSDHQVHYNSTAYLGTSFSEKIANQIFTSDYEKRFIDKLKTKSKFVKSNGSILERGPLKPYEGDFVLQSRFGAAFRFSSTGNKAPWSNKANVNNEVGNFSKTGDPILVVSANKRDTTNSVVENVNTDQSSIYFCSTQVINVNMSTARTLATHKHKYDMKGVTEVKDYSKFLETMFIVGPPPGAPILNVNNGANATINGSGGGTVTEFDKKFAQKYTGGVYPATLNSDGTFAVRSVDGDRTWYVVNDSYKAGLVDVTVPLDAGKSSVIKVRPEFATKLNAAFTIILNTTYNDKPLRTFLKTTEGGLAVRNVTGGSRLSHHAWGFAIDVNASLYPYGTSFPSKPTREQDIGFKQIADIMAQQGIGWLKSTDPMHFSINEIG